MLTGNSLKNKTFIIAIVAVVIFSSLSILPQNTAKALSNVHVSLSDYRPYSTGVQYNISFTTASNSGLYTGNQVQIYFYKKLPSSGDTPEGSIINEGIVNYPADITLNGAACGGIITASQGQALLDFRVPDNWTSVTNINIIIYSAANFKNPGPGTYFLRVKTSLETTPQPSNEYIISNPQLQSVAVTVNPPYAGKNARYDITARTNNYSSSSLSGGSDQIRAQFPSGTSLPTVMNINTISVKYGSTEKFVATSTYVSGNAVQFTIPSGISVPSNSEFTVVFYESAGIVNPQSPGGYKLSLETLDSSSSVKDDLTESASYSITATSVTSATIVVEPMQIGAPAKYTIGFRTGTSGNLAAGSGEIHIKFPDASTFFVPPTIAASQVSVNNTAPLSVQVIGKEIKIVVSQNIQVNSEVYAVIQSGSGIKNSTQTGTYKLSVWTTSDPSPVDTPNFTISPSAVSSVKVTVTPQLAGMQAMYIVILQTGASGILNPGDTITIKFPQGTYVPSYIPLDKVKINNQSASLVSVSGTTVLITTSITIPSSYTVAIHFATEAGIKNPSTPQSYKVLVHTSKETTDVESSPYDIIKGVSTSLNITPQVPDGENGFYRTSPTIEIKANAPQGLAYTIFYKWDDVSNFEKYLSPIKTPEGNHALSYYSLDSYNNKEETHTQSFKVDTQKPALSITSPEANKTFYDKNVLISGVTEPGLSLFALAGSTKTQLVVDTEGKFQYNFTFFSEGNATITFTAEDVAGNIITFDFSLRYVFQRNIMLIVGTKVGYINGEEISIAEAPFIYKGRVFVPIRFISETFGAQVIWDAIFKIVTINLNSQILRLQVGNLTADVNGKAASLDVAPIIKNNTTFVPIRFISEAFGASVDWDSVHGIVKITYPKKSIGS